MPDWLTATPEEDGVVNYYESDNRLTTHNSGHERDVSVDLNLTKNGAFNHWQFNLPGDRWSSAGTNYTFTSNIYLGDNSLSSESDNSHNGLLFNDSSTNGQHGKLLTSFVGEKNSSITLRQIGEPSDKNSLSGIRLIGSNLDGQSTLELSFNGLEYIAIHDYELGIASTSRGSDFNLKMSDIDYLEISSTDGEKMRRGIISSGESLIDIQTNKKIKIDIEGWDKCLDCGTLGSGLVTGNGIINLKSKDISLKGQHSDTTNAKGYEESYAIQASASLRDAQECSIKPYIKKTDSTIRIEAENDLSLETNWGGVSAESDADYWAKVILKAKSMTITSAGTVSHDEIQSGYEKDIHAGIRAISFDSENNSTQGNKEASVTINGEAVNVSYSKKDLLANETKHDMLYAWGDSAVVNINANKLSLNQGVLAGSPAEIRNIAFADKGGEISLNANIGLESGDIESGDLVAYGNLTARYSGKILTNLGSQSILVGSAFDNSFVHYSVEKPNDGYFHYDDQGQIKLSGTGGSLWILREYSDGGIDFKLSDPTASTIYQLEADTSSTTTNPFIVDLRNNSSIQQLNVSNLQGMGPVQFQLRLNISERDISSTPLIDNDRILVENLKGNHGLFISVNNHNIEVPKSLDANWLAMVVNQENDDNGQFYLANANQVVDIGNYQYKLTNKVSASQVGGDDTSQYWYLERTEGSSQAADTTTEIAGTQRFLHWTDLQDLRKRLGEIRYGGQDGMWVRTTIQKDKTDASGRTKGLEQDYYGFNWGYDKLISVDEEHLWLLGANLTYGKADQKTRRSGGSGDTKRYGFNLYATWASNDGRYADFVFTGDKFDQNVTTYANDVTQNGSYDTWGLGFSIEVGKMFSSETKDYSWGPWYRHTWIEPQLQLAYYYLNGTDYQLSNNGIRVSLKDDDSLIGRAGIVIGSRWNYGENYNSIDRGYLQLLMKGGVRHDFLGDYSLSLNDQLVNKDIGQTTIYYGLGADWQLNDRTRVYMNVERESGDNYSKEYEASIGLKINFD